jgi:hypothetical protein
VTAQDVQKIAGMSSGALRAKTGKGWGEWLAILDGEGAADMSHKDIAAMLHEKYGVPAWWAQSVTVGYEQARGRREKHQAPGGYQASASKTLSVPLATLYRAWAEEAVRSRWMPEPIQVTKATENKSLRAASSDGRTRISAGFYAKGDAKSQVALQHEKLASADEVVQSKAYWGDALDRLKAMLEGQAR